MKQRENKQDTETKKTLSSAKRAAASRPAAVAGAGKSGPIAATVAAKGKSVALVKAKAAGGLSKGATHIYASSEARSKWSEVKDHALRGEPVFIQVGNGRALQIVEVGVSYGELEYGVTAKQIHERSAKNKTEIRKEVRDGKVRRIS